MKKRSIPRPAKNSWNTGGRSPEIKVRQAFSELQSAKTHLSSTKNKNIQFSPKTFVRQLFAHYSVFTLHTKLFFTRGSVGRSITQTFTRILVVTTISTFLYICFIDTNFAIKHISIKFTNQSYLEEARINTLLSIINKNRLAGIIPLNSYWFLNSESLTSIGKSVSPDITRVELVSREWPDQASLSITTVPITATLNYGSSYVILSRNGQILGRDSVSLRSNVIRLNSFSTPLTFLENDSLVANNNSLLQKVFFTIQLQNILLDLDLQISESVISSDIVTDSDVYITVNKTKLLFSYTALNSENLITRITRILKDTGMRAQVLDEKISYIDMRFPKTVFVCLKDTSCAN